jgi:CDP-diacylglycerol--glycerol-3-phosphate 3-phosphatidyltransferase
MDLACSIALFAALVVMAAAYGVRILSRGRARHERVDREGKSALVGKGAMEMLYWAGQPLATACEKCGISADAVTWSSLGLGLAAAFAFATGHLGLGAALATVGAAADAIDGMLARRAGTASAAGEVLDAAMDRYVDFALLGGLAFHFRDRAVALAIALLAILASFMVSYSTAKAEALHVAPPRGSMRRTERAVLIVVGAALTPIAARVGLAYWRELPIMLALGMIAIAGNSSAVARLAAVRAAVRRAERGRASHSPAES